MRRSISTRTRRYACSASAFTLIELLVVVAIIAVLISILLPSLGRSRENARMTACRTNLRAIGQLLVMYTNIYDSYPYGDDSRGGALPRTPGGISWFRTLPTPVRARPTTPPFRPTQQAREFCKMFICPTVGIDNGIAGTPAFRVPWCNTGPIPSCSATPIFTALLGSRQCRIHSSPPRFRGPISPSSSIRPCPRRTYLTTKKCEGGHEYVGLLRRCGCQPCR